MRRANTCLLADPALRSDWLWHKQRFGQKKSATTDRYGRAVGCLPRCTPGQHGPSDRNGDRFLESKCELVRECRRWRKCHGGNDQRFRSLQRSKRDAGCRHSDDQGRQRSRFQRNRHDHAHAMESVTDARQRKPSIICNRRIHAHYQRRQFRQLARKSCSQAPRSVQPSSPQQSLRRPAQRSRQAPSQSRCRIRIPARANRIR